MRSNKAVFYITNRLEDVERAIQSAQSVDKWCPDVDTYLYLVNYPTDQGAAGAEKVFSYIHPWRSDKPIQKDRWFLTQNQEMPAILRNMQEANVEMAIYMDCDTYVIEDISEIWGVLSACDLAGTISPRRYRGNIDSEIPASFPEWNIGVNPMYLGDGLIHFWENVAQRHQEHIAEYENDDQCPLRQTIYSYMVSRRSVQFVTLAPEWNFRFNFACQASGKVRILHAKSPNLDEVARIVNERGDFRAWDSGINLS